MMKIYKKFAPAAVLMLVFMLLPASRHPGAEPAQDRQPDASEIMMEKFMREKERAMENVLGKMHGLVGHAVVPFEMGGAVDMYYFPSNKGTAFATMELFSADSSGPRPGRIGAFELVAFTRHGYSAEKSSPFSQIERRMCGIFTVIGRYSRDAVINPRETMEIPQDRDGNICLVFDEYRKEGREFTVGGKAYGLLLVIEVHRCEMEYAMKNGGQRLLDLLKKAGRYPFSDLDREPVVK